MVDRLVSTEGWQGLTIWDLNVTLFSNATAAGVSEVVVCDRLAVMGAGADCVRSWCCRTARG